MIVTDLPVKKLYRRNDGRAISGKAVSALVESIREIGLRTPLVVRPCQRYLNGVLADAWEISAGAHRHEAAIRLGLDEVPCVVVDDDDLRAELVMIDENLVRSELVGAERAKQTARRKEIYETLHPETKQGAVGAGRPKIRVAENATLIDEPAERFTSATAKTLGRSERAVQLDAERGEKIAPDVLDKVAGTHLDKNRYLDELKGLPHKEQRERVGADLHNDKAGADVGKKQASDLKTKHQAAEALAERIVSNFPTDELDAAIANAFACGALHLGRALARLSALEPVMDRKFG